MTSSTLIDGQKSEIYTPTARFSQLLTISQDCLQSCEIANNLVWTIISLLYQIFVRVASPILHEYRLGTSPCGFHPDKEIGTFNIDSYIDKRAEGFLTNLGKITKKYKQKSSNILVPGGSVEVPGRFRGGSVVFEFF